MPMCLLRRACLHFTDTFTTLVLQGGGGTAHKTRPEASQAGRQISTEDDKAAVTMECTGGRGYKGCRDAGRWRQGMQGEQVRQEEAD